jgi:hypothetical protein
MRKPLLALCLLALTLPTGCGTDEETPPDPLRNAGGFCKSWAQSACQQKVVDNCNAPSMDDCIDKQEDFCLGVIPENYSSKHAKECLSAVKAAYTDAVLSLDEIDVVIRLGAPCDRLSSGTSDQGDSCEKNDDCDTAAGLVCVIKAGQASGSCEEPVEVGGGEACDQPEQVCSGSFYCDGENCLAYKKTDADCEADYQCKPSDHCVTETDAPTGSCVARLASSETCTADADCQSRYCAIESGGTEGLCANSIILSLHEPLCENLR